MPSHSRDKKSADHSVFREPAFLADPANASKLIDCDLPCPRCRYNLRGLTVDRPCPECGHSIAHVAAQGAGQPTDRKESDTADRHAPNADELAVHSVYNELAIFPSRDTGRTIDRNWSCGKCGENLRGRPIDSACPNCGQIPRELPTPLDKPSYGSWLQARIAATPIGAGWVTAAGIAVVGGLWAVVGAMFANRGGIVGVVVFSPVAEEVMKIGLVVAVIETRPFLFASRAQILVAAIGSALGFALIEKLLYLNVYVGEPSPGLVVWRWTVCLAIHVGCTIIAALGAMRVWRRTITELRRPNISPSLGPLVVAAIVHGTYNGLAVAMSLARFSF